MNEGIMGALKPLLEEFRIPLPETLDSCNLIDLDYGDETVSANFVIWRAVQEAIELVALPFRENGILFKHPNVYVIGSNVKRLVDHVRRTEWMTEHTAI